MPIRGHTFAAWRRVDFLAGLAAPQTAGRDYGAGRELAKTSSWWRQWAWGQDEIEIRAAWADITVVMLVPGMGDDVQSIKSRHHGDCRHFCYQQE